jgi:uncharacterized membrane-anchored protein
VKEKKKSKKGKIKKGKQKKNKMKEKRGKAEVSAVLNLRPPAYNALTCKNKPLAYSLVPLAYDRWRLKS